MALLMGRSRPLKRTSDDLPESKTTSLQTGLRCSNGQQGSTQGLLRVPINKRWISPRTTNITIALQLRCLISGDCS
uniref:Uncharacterized protein n=1 Tax=Physcomitrium patens TaxID=3218 RepID=A0A2K1J7X6_PHYPA|nr:hypothetical protein PHYPA_020741 [Physcomitrium patens]